MQMPEKAIAALKSYRENNRGRPKGVNKHHGFGTENQRKEWIGRLSCQKTARGLRLLKTYYLGNVLTPMQAIEAQCCCCLGYYSDVGSMADCESPSCPLYYYMPYRKKNL
jgi:hypothetical protein